MTPIERVESIIKPVIESLGYQLVERELVQDGYRQVLRVYIDKEGGVQIADCETVSRHLSANLDVEDPVESAYDLEVSSPGIERPLRYLDDFAKYVGETIKLKTLQPIAGRQNYKGILKAVQNETIIMWIDGQEYTVPYSALHRARLIKDWNGLNKKSKGD